MNERDIFDAITRDRRTSGKDADQRPVWKRLLASLKIGISLRPNLKHPVKHFTIKGRIEF
jgi:hypothetical protein